MVIKSDNNKKILSLSDIAKEISKPGLLFQFSEEIKSFFELNNNFTKKDTYENLIKKHGYTEESPLLYKSREDLYLYYDLISGKFKLYTNWGDVQARPLLEYYTSVLVGVDNFKSFMKKNYNPENPVVIYSEDNKYRNWQNRKKYPRIFEVVNLDEILNLLQKKFESQYKNNLRKFLIENPDSLKFSSELKDEVFPFFLKASLDYKISFFSRNYDHFCKDYKLKDEYCFLKDIYNAFKEWNLSECYSDKFIFDDLLYNLQKSETDIDKEISKIVSGKLAKEQYRIDKGKSELEKSSTIHDYMSAIAANYRGVGRPNSDYVINWEKVLSVYGEAVSRLILDNQAKNNGYFNIGEPYKDRGDSFSALSTFTNYLSCDYAKGKTYKFDLFYLVNKDIDLVYIESQINSLTKIIENGTNIELTMFHQRTVEPEKFHNITFDFRNKTENGIYTLLSNKYNSEVLFNTLLSLNNNKRKSIIFRKSEIDVIRSLVEFGLLEIPIDNFFERLEEFTLI